MTTAAAAELMTTEELLALPDDGRERWLIRGKLRERGMTRRNRYHSRAMARITYLLEHWHQQHSAVGGQVVTGEAGFILRRNPDSTCGIAVAFVGPAVVAIESPTTTLFDGPPILAVEILSPNNTKQEVTEKVRDYLACGVKLVWVVDTDFQLVTVHQPNAPSVSFNATQTISADPHLPGFTAPVADFFR